MSYIESGNSQQNAYGERYNRTKQYDGLDQKLFNNPDLIRHQAQNCLYHYNHERPNLGNNDFTPIRKLIQTA
ncbi:integrase core domain-containing protein [Psychrobacter sp. 1Y1]|uniref:integrase core domain-containing protein n=1 Tax=Psychrobacter sp. 1Y1 TaxID=3453574 RepID=UPI003F447C50